MQARQRNQIRYGLLIKNSTSRQTLLERAKSKVHSFLVAAGAKQALMKKLRTYYDFVQYWKAKGKKVQDMIKIKRSFLTDIFEREKRTMLKHYQGKKKFKKTL